MQGQGGFIPAGKNASAFKVSISKIADRNAFESYLSDDGDDAAFDSIRDGNEDGGPGSGNFNHKGVPGQLGGSAPGNGNRKPVSGKDISGTFAGNPTTKEVLKAQEFDGLPKILSRKEFDEAVKASKFIAQRTYAASSQEILDAYHDQLMNGDFYVECTEGGSQYGQGMYCAADYTGKLSDGIKAEMEHYIALGKTRNSPKDSPHRQEVADMQSEEADKIYRDAIEEKIKDFTGDEAFIFKCYSLHNSTPEEQRKAFDIMGKWSKEKMDSFYKRASDAVEDAQAQMSAVKNIPLHEYAKAHGIEIESDPVHRVETLTLDPSAKIVSYDEISRMQEEEGSKFRDSELASYSQNAGPECEALFRIETGKTQSGDFGIVTKWQTEHPEEFKKAEDFYISTKTKASEMLTKFVKMDPGAYAALKGYDAINAKGHGESGSYTVILNRTKTIFLDTDEHADRNDDENSVITFQKGSDGVIYAIRNREVIGWVAVSGSTDESNADGGEGSGNFNHKGREGEVGGSAPSDGTPSSSEDAHAKGRTMQKMTKRRFNDKVAELLKEFADTNGDGTKQHDEIKKMLDELPVGSEITTQYDDGRPPFKSVKKEDGTFYSKQHGTWDTDTVAWDFFADDSNNHAYWAEVSKVAMTEEAMRADFEREQKTYWRNNDQIWSKGGSFTETASVKLKKRDLDAMGDGIKVTLSDGTVCQKIDGKWYESETYKEVDKRKLGSPTIEADFFTTNFGLNGVSAENCEQIRQVYSAMPENLQKKYESTFRETPVTFTNEGTAYFSVRDGTVFLTPDSDEEAVIHEMAHAFDRSFSKEVPNGYDSGTHTLNSASEYIDYQIDHDDFVYDLRSAAEIIGIPVNPDGGFSDEFSDEDRFDKFFEFYRQYRDDPDFSIVSDVISGLTSNSLGESIISGGHHAAYWWKPFGRGTSSSQSKEMWAEYCTLKAHHNDKMLDLMSKVSPRRYKACETAYKEAIEDGQSDD